MPALKKSLKHLWTALGPASPLGLRMTIPAELPPIPRRGRNLASHYMDDVSDVAFYGCDSDYQCMHWLADAQ